MGKVTTNSPQARQVEIPNIERIVHMTRAKLKHVHRKALAYCKSEGVLQVGHGPLFSEPLIDTLSVLRESSAYNF